MKAAPKAWLALVLLAVLAGCVPRTQATGPFSGEAKLIESYYVTADRTRLPYRAWLPSAPPKAVIVALHGMNDYSNQFEDPATYWLTSGIATYAYDQRGFGGDRNRGLWPGRKAMIEDFRTMVRLVRARHPGVPVYAMGMSMGGGVVINVMGEPDPPKLDGLVLVAPAVWGRRSMPFHYRLALWAAAHSVPWMRFSGSSLDRMATDNIDVLRKMGRDPKVIKKTRADAIYGMVRLMDAALAAAPRVRGPILVLYGENDQIIPKNATLRMLRRLPAGQRRIALYKKGYHMLLRDLQARVVHKDIAAWILDRKAPLPSGADKREAFRLLTPKRRSRRSLFRSSRTARARQPQ